MRAMVLSVLYITQLQSNIIGTRTYIYAAQRKGLRSTVESGISLLRNSAVRLRYGLSNEISLNAGRWVPYGTPPVTGCFSRNVMAFL